MLASPAWGMGGKDVKVVLLDVVPFQWFIRLAGSPYLPNNFFPTISEKLSTYARDVKWFLQGLALAYAREEVLGCVACGVVMGVF